MSARYYDLYKHLLGVEYDDGDHDCYGLQRRFYKDCFNMELPNYARSSDFFRAGIDLITPFLREEGFEIVDIPLSRLQFGDGLLISVHGPNWPKGRTNHVASYVGNNHILHHLWQRRSCEDVFSDAWKERVMGVLRHPDVAAKNAERFSQNAVNLIDLLPEHVRRKFIQVDPALVLESASGAGRADPPEQQDRGTTKRKRKPKPDVPSSEG